eukprot:jgi/Mesen1/6579/ME000336S05804
MALSVASQPCFLRQKQTLVQCRAVSNPIIEATPVASKDSAGAPQKSTAYPFAEIEQHWQAYWEEHQTFRTPEEVDTSKPKFYVLDMFPYPRKGQWSFAKQTLSLAGRQLQKFGPSALGRGQGEVQGVGEELSVESIGSLMRSRYLVLAPEHPLVDAITTDEQRAQVAAYVDSAARKSDLERTELQKEKTGVHTGAYARNPATGEPVPIWVADYVLGSYGTGAIMAVPAHDLRDFEFASTFHLPIRQVVAPGDGATWDGEGAYSGDGTMVNYKLRDWLFARQRYWGEPFPIIYPEGSDQPVAISEAELPLTLPDVEDFSPTGTGEPPLAKAASWVNTTDPATGRPARRETNTMPQWAGSCWYYLRFIDPKNSAALIDPAKEKYWGPVDLYVGGAEHSVLHLLYARFWHKVLYDIGVVSTKEPFQCLVNQGMILGEVEYTTFRNEAGQLVSPDEASRTGGCIPERIAESQVTKMGDGYVLREAPGVRVAARAHKMSKSRGNVVNPDDVVAEYGADSLRLYEMFMGPLRDTKVWSTKGVEGVHRFLARAWRLVTGGTAFDATGSLVSEGEASREQRKAIHLCIRRVSEEVDNMRFNTAIAAMMEFINAANKWETRPREALEPFVLLLSPLAPHVAEELWRRLGHSESLAYEPWPQANPEYLKEDTITLPVQVNGKMRGTVELDVNVDEETAIESALADANVARFLEGKTIRKKIYKSGKILNFIVG